MSNPLPWYDQEVPQGLRVRFAPSPTGQLHIGGARTALFNAMLARRHGGTFLLRIEDTDAARSTPENTRIILDGLRWLGLDWDEGPEKDGPSHPYFQSQRGPVHQAALNYLLDQGSAYLCFLTHDELHAMREQAQKEGRPFVQESPFRNASKEDVDRRLKEGQPYTVRFHCPHEEVVIHDELRGEVRFQSREMVGDLILRRSDGAFTYNFVVVVDDLTMGITHVLRGDDHLSNTPKQVMLMKALGSHPPKYAHMPLIHGMDGKKLSKRHGATNVLAYREEGYLPQAVCNFIALLGWHPEGDDEVMSFEDLAKQFALEDIKKSPARLDFDKLQWMNGVYLRQLPEQDYVDRGLTVLEDAGLPVRRDHRDREILLVLWERVRVWQDLPDMASYFYKDFSREDVDPKAEKALFKEDSPALLDQLMAAVEPLDLDDMQATEDALRGLVEQLGEKPKKVFQLLRASVTGRMESPPLFDTLRLAGKDAVLRRLRQARAWQ